MPDNATPPTREQRRAEAVYATIKSIEGKPGAQEYGRLCLKLPILLQQNGLCKTLAYLEAKSKRSHFQQVLNDIERVAGVTRQQARQAPATEYQWLSRDTLRTSVWFKRYAEAVLKVSPDEDGERE